MKLKELLKEMDILRLDGDLETEISGLENDSRLIRPGYLFVAVKGYETDGHLFCRQAVLNGAAAVLLEQEEGLEELCRQRGVAVVKAADSRKALAQAAAAFYGWPARQLNMVGITGTNGKTSTAILSYRILKAAGHLTGVIGTISNFIHNRELSAERTTPEAHQLQKLLAEMRAESVDTAVMEVSSHALELDRVCGIRFKVAAFTNLSLDHLDFHQTMENYLKAKSRLFQMAETGVINADDPVKDELLKENTCQHLCFYSIKDPKADFYADQIEHHLTGTNYRLSFAGRTYPVALRTPGNFSVYNSLAAIAVTYSLGVPMEVILSALAECSQVRGRFQPVQLPGGFTAIVDYAHTPDGLENVLRSINEFKTGRVITVFGCGGDRDRSKRPLMAEIAERYSDYVIITSDNPRTEKPEQIIAEVAAGMTGRAYELETDRRKAIEKALTRAETGDVVLVAGKGHEDYQIIGRQKQPFDDVKIIEEWGSKQC